MKWLIVTGDDFGASPGINSGIIQAHRNGILTSASLLVNRRASAEAAVLGRAYRTLSLGLHLELELARVPHNGGGQFERQLARFQELAGALPTHLDSHHDTHHDPRILPHLLAWAGSAGVAVRGHASIRQLRKFYGRWNRKSHLEQIRVEGLLRLLDTELTEGITELTCHPGYVDEALRSSYSAEREVELQTLCDGRVRQAIVERDISLIGFRELPSLATHLSPPEATV